MMLRFALAALRVWHRLDLWTDGIVREHRERCQHSSNDIRL